MVRRVLFVGFARFGDETYYLQRRADLSQQLAKRTAQVVVKSIDATMAGSPRSGDQHEMPHVGEDMRLPSPT